MMHSTQALYDATRSCLVELDQQIEAVKKQAALRLPIHEEPPPGFVYSMFNRDGVPVMQDLLVAKAHCLSALASLKASEVANKKPRGGW